MIPSPQYYLANWIYPESFANLLKFRDDLIERLNDNKLSKTEREITIENIHESDESLKEIIKRRQAAFGSNFEMIDEMKTFKPYKDTSGKQHKKRGDIALFHGKNIEWEKIIISLPAKDETASYELKVRIKSTRESESFSLKEFGFWNNRDNKPNRLFVALKALANVKSTIGHEGNKDELIRFGKTVSTLGKLLNRQLGIDGSPFNKKELLWSPKFKIKPDKDEGFITRDSKTVPYEDWMESDEDLMN